MSIFLIANGDIQDLSWLVRRLARAQAIVAVDGGAHHLLNLGLTPNILLGDLDSVDPKLAADLARRGTKILKFPAEKNETDLELALLFAVQRPQWRDFPIVIVGVLGGRLDQTLANILLLGHVGLAGRDIRIVDSHQEAWLVRDQTTIEGAPGDTVSLIPLGGPATVRATVGLKWPLNNDTLTFGAARGVSNVMTVPTATVELSAGRLLCIHTDASWRR